MYGLNKKHSWAKRKYIDSKNGSNTANRLVEKIEEKKSYSVHQIKYHYGAAQKMYGKYCSTAKDSLFFEKKTTTGY